QWASRALTRVPVSLPGAGCTAMPAGLSTTIRCASSNSTASAIASGCGAMGRGGGTSIRYAPGWARAEPSVTAAAPRNTRPCPISACRRARESSGRCSASALSTRPPAASGPRVTSRTSPASPSSSSSEAMLFAGLGLAVGDRALAEQVLPKLGVDFAVVAPDPLQDHGRVLQLLARIVQQDGLQLGVFGVVGALAVPVDGLE